MNGQELRIGNWINDESAGIRQWMKDDYVNYSGYDGRDENYISDKIEPIPLSPEILLKCGFEFDGDEYSYEYKNIDADIRFSLKDGVFVPNPYYTGQPFTESAYPKYLHQLQNLIFSLTGEELTIEDLQLNGASQEKINSSNEADSLKKICDLYGVPPEIIEGKRIYPADE